MQRQGVIYSIFVRNFSESGDFKGVIPKLDDIKALGVDVIWFMPIHPIGQDNRKGVDGSPYANYDYRAVNPEYGSLEDFIQVCSEIHKRDMKVMIDVVYNHTSPDSVLVKEHPEWFYYTPEGKRGNRVGDWSDIVDLDYQHRGLWDYQIETLKYWAQYVDGYRCDVAPLVPIEFWKEARQAVAEIKEDFIWLSESVEASFIKHLRQAGTIAHADCEMYQAFDLLYDYDVHHLFHGYLRGTNSLKEYIDRVNLQEIIYPKEYMKIRNLENHDNPRAAGLISQEQDLINWTAFMYFQKGWVLLYNGQEHQDSVQLSLFDRDPVNWNPSKDISPMMRHFHDIMKANIPTSSNARYEIKVYEELDAVVVEHETSDQVFTAVCSFKEKAGTLPIMLADGEHKDLVSGQTITIEKGHVSLGQTPLAFAYKKA